MVVRITKKERKAWRLSGLNHCVLFTYSHGKITEGFAAELLGLNRLDFRDRWINYLQENSDVAKESGFEHVLTTEATADSTAQA